MHAVSAWAAPAEMLADVDCFSAQRVVPSASRLSQVVNRASAAVAVITREMIEASGLRPPPDPLRLLPGFRGKRSCGNLPTVVHPGLSGKCSRRVQVPMNGRTVCKPVCGQVPWRGVRLALDDIPRDYGELTSGRLFEPRTYALLKLHS